MKIQCVLALCLVSSFVAAAPHPLLYTGDGSSPLSIANTFSSLEKRSDVEKRVKIIVAEQLGLPLSEIKNEASFVDDLGADELDRAELVIDLEAAFDIEIPDEDAEKITTVQDAINYDIVAERLGVPTSEIKNQASFVNDLGADELDVVEIIKELEKEFDISISDEDAEKITTVQNAIDYVRFLLRLPTFLHDSQNSFLPRSETMKIQYVLALCLVSSFVVAAPHPLLYPGDGSSPLSIAKTFSSLEKRSNVEKRVKNIVAEILGLPLHEITNEASFVNDLGADELERGEIDIALEAAFDIEIPEEQAEKITTVQDAINYVGSHEKAAGN
ncbi:hypothetical protein BGZ83_010304 [Gryganskiella cystojenkinii]|nr:hypothetical protein BGZ83_010304 [Gryganskiella cystojenkinii]